MARPAPTTTGVVYLRESRTVVGSGFPKSGTAGAGVGVTPAYGHYVDRNTGVRFVNLGTQASPYWQPIDPFHPRLVYALLEPGFHFGQKALSDTNASAALEHYLPGGLFRAFGQGIEQNDSGFPFGSQTVIGTSRFEGAPGELTTTDEDAHTANLGLLSSSGVGSSCFLPTTNGPFVADCVISNKDDILLRANYFGFFKQATSAFDPPMTGSGTTITFAGASNDCDAVAAFFFSVELDDVDRWFFPYGKDNPSNIATTATGVDTGVNVAAAGTYQRLRVEVDADGGVRYFINKVLIGTLPAATLDPAVSVTPVLGIENVDGGVPGVQILNVKHFSSWGLRPDFTLG